MCQCVPVLLAGAFRNLNKNLICTEYCYVCWFGFEICGPEIFRLQALWNNLFKYFLLPKSTVGMERGGWGEVSGVAEMRD